MQTILIHLFDRYYDMSIKHPSIDLKFSISQLCEVAVYHLTEQTITFDKANRWLGFVQGVLISHDITTSDIERDYTRPLFQSYYKEHNILQDKISVR